MILYRTPMVTAFLLEDSEVHYGAQNIGATVIPISTGQTRRQIEIMEDFGTTVLIFTPSYGLYLAEVAEEEGVNPGRS